MRWFLLLLLIFGSVSVAAAQESETPPGQEKPAAVEPAAKEEPAESKPDVAPATEAAAGETADDTSTEPVTGDPQPEEAKFTRYDALVASLTIFILAIFIGFELITKVPPTLHTPLMSGSNAISGISIVGALIAASTTGAPLAALIGLVAVVMATINVVGGYLVTHRMLEMFKPKR